MKSVSLFTAAGLAAFLMTGCGEEAKKGSGKPEAVIKKTEEDSRKNQESQRVKQEPKVEEKPKVEDKPGSLKTGGPDPLPKVDDKPKAEVKPKADDKPKSAFDLVVMKKAPEHALGLFRWI